MFFKGELTGSCGEKWLEVDGGGEQRAARQTQLQEKKEKKSLSNPIASLKPSVLEILEPPLLIGIRVLKSLRVCESQPVAFILSSSLTSFVALVTLFNRSEPWFLIHKMGPKFLPRRIVVRAIPGLSAQIFFPFSFPFPSVPFPSFRLT